VPYTLCIDWVPVLDREPIAWLAASGMTAWGRKLRSWLPAVFEGYVRILHPAREMEAGVERFVRWSEIAAWSGKRLTRASSISDLVRRVDGRRWDDKGPDELPWRWLPANGYLEAPHFFRLVEHLAADTSGAIWALVWYGYGGLPVRESLVRGAAMHIVPSERGDRAYLLFRGAIAEVETLLRPKGYPLEEVPSFWWPEDRRWFVSTDIDNYSTYVGASSDTVARLLADDLLEVLPADPEDEHDGPPALDP
jgi:hypothetical protein